MATVGRAMQILGMALLPLAMLLELSRALGPTFGVKHMLVMLLFGAAMFYFGRLMEGYGRRA